jgi:hypothetical protein
MKGYRLGLDKAETLFDVEVGDRCGSYVLHDGHVFADCYGTYRCLDLTGKILWQKSTGGKISSPVLADGKIFHIVSGRGKLTMFSATPTMPATFFEVRVPVQELTSPAISSGKLFIRLTDGVACYDLTKVPADAVIAAKAPTPVTAPATAPATKGLITFVDVSPSYEVNRKAIKDQVWPPEKEAEAAALDWALNKELDADGWISFTEVQDARGMLTGNAIAYARVLLEAAAPGKLALSLTVPPTPGNPQGLVVWVNGANVLRHDVAHGHVKEREELVVNLVAGRTALLVRVNSGHFDRWGLTLQAKALDGLVVKQVASTSAGSK